MSSPSGSHSKEDSREESRRSSSIRASYRSSTAAPPPSHEYSASQSSARDNRDTEHDSSLHSSSSYYPSRNRRRQSPSYHSRHYSRSRSRSPRRDHGSSRKYSSSPAIDVWVATSYQSYLGQEGGFVAGIGLQFDDSIGKCLQAGFYWKKPKSPVCYADILACILILAVLKMKNMDHYHVTIYTKTLFLSKLMDGNPQDVSVLDKAERLFHQFLLELMRDRPGRVVMRHSTRLGHKAIEYMGLAKSAAATARKDVGFDIKKIPKIPNCLWASPFGQQFASFSKMQMKHFSIKVFEDALHDTFPSSKAPRPRTSTPPPPPPPRTLEQPPRPPSWPSELPYPLPFELASKLISELMKNTAPPTRDELSRLFNDQHLLSSFDPFHPQQHLQQQPPPQPQSQLQQQPSLNNHSQYAALPVPYHPSPVTQPQVMYQPLPGQPPQVNQPPSAMTYQFQSPLHTHPHPGGPSNQAIYHSMGQAYYQQHISMHATSPSLPPPSAVYPQPNPNQPSIPADPRLRSTTVPSLSHHQNHGLNLNHQSQSPPSQVTNIVHPSKIEQVDGVRSNQQDNQISMQVPPSQPSPNLPTNFVHPSRLNQMDSGRPASYQQPPLPAQWSPAQSPPPPAANTSIHSPRGIQLDGTRQSQQYQQDQPNDKSATSQRKVKAEPLPTVTNTDSSTS